MGEEWEGKREGKVNRGQERISRKRGERDKEGIRCRGSGETDEGKTGKKDGEGGREGERRRMAWKMEEKI